jgi:hypothetical protein
MTKRLLVTGSRTWSDEQMIRQVLCTALSQWDSNEIVVLISGACPTGADAICEKIWSEGERPVERHPAEWKKFGKRAGFIRNRDMVASGADLCLAFIKDESKGATMTANLAEDSGIATWRYELWQPKRTGE